MHDDRLKAQPRDKQDQEYANGRHRPISVTDRHSSPPGIRGTGKDSRRRIPEDELSAAEEEIEIAVQLQRVSFLPEIVLHLFADPRFQVKIVIGLLAVKSRGGICLLRGHAVVHNVEDDLYDGSNDA